MAAPDDTGPPYSPPWPPGRRAVAAMVWSGFLAACLGSLLGSAWLTPTAVYTLGFFLFFTVGFAGAFLGVYLTRPPE
jgi:hypothetical protein